MAWPRVILHADMDAFYASVEQRDDPSLRGRPVIVGGTGPRGVVSAASYEARVFGVRSAMPSAQARKLCPQGVFLAGSMQRYAEESARIFEIFQRFTPAVEGLSLDEAFLDLSGTQRLLGAPREAAAKLRAAVRAERGLAVSVGIAPVKLVAKIASDLAKPDGLLEVLPEQVGDFLAPLPVGRLWGVGPVAEQRLLRAGFSRIGDLVAAEPARLQRLLGPWGVALARLGRGLDLSEVEPYRDAVSYSEENTFATDVSELRVLESAIGTHADSVARRLRHDEVAARTVVLKLKLARRVASGPRGFPLLTRRVTLPEPCDDGRVIAHAARALLARAALTEPVRLVGVGVTGIERKDAQLPLFGKPREARRRERLNRALDALHERFGEDAVVRGEARHAERAGLSLQRKRGESSEPGKPAPASPRPRPRA
jgi:DNA polymerase-4